MAAGPLSYLILNGLSAQLNFQGWSNASGVITPVHQEQPYQGTPLGFSTISVGSGSASSLSPPAGALYALVAVEGPDVRWRDDGSAPTTTVGMRLYGGVNPVLFAGDLSVAQFIAVSGTATLNLAFYK